jgi:hypothetical protein
MKAVREGARLREEVMKFRAWAEARTAERHLWWETDYPGWGEAWDVVEDFLRTTSIVGARPEAIADLLYLLARDHECQFIAQNIAALRPREELFVLAEHARVAGESDARWQLAVQLDAVFPAYDVRVERVLLDFVRDDEEYVRRRCLMELGRRRSPEAERLALAAWDEVHDDLPSARMTALEVLAQVGSTHLPARLAEAAADPNQHLAELARRMLAGEPEYPVRAKVAHT